MANNRGKAIMNYYKLVGGYRMLKLRILHVLHRIGIIENSLHREKKHILNRGKNILDKEKNILNVSHNNSTKSHSYRIGILLLIGLGFLLGGSLWRYSRSLETMALQEGIANEVIRFHVLANSDSDEDQQLKIKVKSQVVVVLQENLKEVGSIEEARKIIINLFDEIEEVALKVIAEEGYSYGVTVSMEKTMFPIKKYGDIVLPPGEYESLLIKIGEAEGKNWWCIVFPTLCYVDETYQVVPDTSKEQLKYLLTEEEYNSILQGNNVKVRVKFKLFEWMKDLF